MLFCRIAFTITGILIRYCNFVTMNQKRGGGGRRIQEASKGKLDLSNRKICVLYCTVSQRQRSSRRLFRTLSAQIVAPHRHIAIHEFAKGLLAEA